MDDRLHRWKCRLYKRGHRRAFRVLRWLSMPLCDRVAMLDHVR